MINASQIPKPIRVGVILPQDGPFDHDALQYLVLHLNTLQAVVEFEFVTPHDDPCFKQMSGKQPFDWAELRTHVPACVERLRHHLAVQSKSFDLAETSPEHFVFLTSTRLKDNWYSKSSKELTLVSLASWKRRMAPPSLFEFVVTFLLAEALYLVVAQDREEYGHLGTKGCVWDFNASLDDTRYKVFNGFICAHCMRLLRKKLSEPDIAQLQLAFRREWLGKLDDPKSPASITKKLGYDLFAATGLSATLWERLISSLRDDGFKEILKLVGGVLLAALLLWLGLKTR